MNLNTFIEELKKLGIDLNETQLNQFEKYYELLVEWNEKMNLTAIIDKEEVYLKHFYDSLTFFKIMDVSKEISICDVGAGAGFPSIPLKIAFPKITVTIIDSLGKRITFLNEVINQLGLQHTYAYHARAEEYAELHRESFDVVTARAVARLNILSELCIPLVKIDGHFIAMKAQSGTEEIEEAKSGISKLGCKIVDTLEFTLPFEGSSRVLIDCLKVKNTPKEYPRAFGQIKKKPLK